MKLPRSSGILLHPTSLPGPSGIGDLGAGAYAFADFLSNASQHLWQVLPLGPTGYGDSPYQCFSAFAGNPLLISLEKLVEEDLLSATDLAEGPFFTDAEVDYGSVIHFKLPLLRKAHQNFKKQGRTSDWNQLHAFCRQNASWLDDYAKFAAFKEAHGGAVWNQWDPELASRRPESVARWSESLGQEIESHKYVQYQFFKQWSALKNYCHRKGIRIFGDVPIFVAHDSADVWAHPELFELEADGQPRFVAGVPPDYFSATGQLWGNPVYRWEALAHTGYAWWIDRLRETFALVDIVRLDHFRGFEGYWEVPANETTAVNGRWVKGPGVALFQAVQESLGELPIVAENLGMITPEVEQLRAKCGFPGMAILQFAFDLDGSSFRPHNFSHDLVVYTGTHDNDTTVGWWSSSDTGNSTRPKEEIDQEREFALKYLGCHGLEINWAFIRCALASVADTAIIPLQDVLGLGSEARMNLPARPGGNWRWRYKPGDLTAQSGERLKELTEIFGRAQITAKTGPISEK
jgi:4-alpha-glucanotransferase